MEECYCKLTKIEFVSFNKNAKAAYGMLNSGRGIKYTYWLDECHENYLEVEMIYITKIALNL